MMSRANGRAWGENREHYSNQLGGQVRHDDDDADYYDYDHDAANNAYDANDILTFSNISGCGEEGGVATSILTFISL